jgi:2-iminobutanoate/2-iminopropanoate deaminase
MSPIGEGDKSRIVTKRTSTKYEEDVWLQPGLPAYFVLLTFMKTSISSSDAPTAIGPYSPAVRAGQLLFVSGQVPIDPATGNIVDGDIAAQTRRVLDNVGALLTAAGRSFSDVVRTTIFLADMNDFAAVNAVYGGYFKEPFPARATVQVARLPKDARVEIDAIATYEAG